MANELEARVSIPKYGAFRVNLRSLLQFTGQSGLLIAATALASLLAYLLQVVLARGLNVAEFGTFVTLQSLVYIVAVPVSTLTMVSAHFIASYRVSRSTGAIRAFLRGMQRDLLPWGVGLMLLVLLSGAFLAERLNLPSASLVVTGGGAVVLFGALAVERGGLLGLGLVGHLSLNTILEAMARLTLCVGALWLGWQLQGVWLGWTCAYLVAAVAAGPVTRRVSKTQQFDRAAVWRYTAPVLVGTGLLALLMHLDMVVVTAYFNREMAGAYAASLVYARAGLLPAMAIAPLTLSVATANHRQGKSTADVLGLSLLLAVIPSGLATLVAVAAPHLVVKLLFGASYTAAGNLLAPLSLIYSLMALLFVYVRYCLAISNYSFFRVLSIGIVGEIGAFLLFHRQLTDVVWILLVTQVLLVLFFVLRFGLQTRLEILRRLRTG
jgi:O-antigen/teichoic acid export membrane protein